MKKPELLRSVGYSSCGKIIKYLYRCECGKEFISDKSKINSGNTKSCGCLKISTAYKLNFKHGGKKSSPRLYNTWQGMRNRCYYKKDLRYSRYGGRGIKICKSWKEFTAFKNWALKSGYKGNLTLDRINNDKGYKPSNCRWATRLEQSQNRSFTIGIQRAKKIKEDLKNGIRVIDIANKYGFRAVAISALKAGRTYKNVI